MCIRDRVVAVLAAMVVYGAVLVLLGGVTEEELLDMPKGASVASLCRKLHLKMCIRDRN